MSKAKIKPFIIWWFNERIYCGIVNPIKSDQMISSVISTEMKTVEHTFKN